MKKIKEGYYYLFYRFYLFAKTPPFVDDSSDWTAAGFIAILEVFIYFSAAIFYTFYFDKNYLMPDDSPLFIVPMGAIAVINYLTFLRNNTWMNYYEKFENWPSEKNKKFGIIVLCVIMAILLCFSFAIYLTTRTDFRGK